MFALELIEKLKTLSNLDDCKKVEIMVNSKIYRIHDVSVTGDGMKIRLTSFDHDTSSDAIADDLLEDPPGCFQC